MARITNLRDLESCLDRSEAVEVSLDQPVSEALVRRLGQAGILQYFPHFPRPYFRVDHATDWVVQGIVGSERLRIQLFGERTAEVLERLRCLIEE
ncbi:MAG TPA: hypothetical protein P5234_07405 [Thermoanaerobaculaceae bacterium]|nr:hypothetical protein [Thermoanaerobaculaceae bacterium]HRS16065.1 hypothetical protein [Thermoanaerobaculaceae bacterium]